MPGHEWYMNSYYIAKLFCYTKNAFRGAECNQENYEQELQNASSEVPSYDSAKQKSSVNGCMDLKPDTCLSASVVALLWF